MTTSIESDAYVYMMRKIRPYVVSGRGTGPDVFKMIQASVQRGIVRGAELQQVLEDLEIETKVNGDPLAFNRLRLVERLLTLL